MLGRKTRLERALRAAKPKPSRDLQRRLTAAVRGERPSLRPRRSRPRLTLAVAMLVALAVLAGSFGGFSYAAHHDDELGGKIVRVVKKPKKKVTRAQRIRTRAAAEGGRYYLASIGTYVTGQWVCHWAGAVSTTTPRGRMLATGRRSS